MHNHAEFRNLTFTNTANRVPSLCVDGVRQIATEAPELLADAAAWARKFAPRSGLGRLA